MSVKRTSMARDHLSRKRFRSVAVATSLMAAAGCSLAAPIDVGNPDIELRWDNTRKLHGRKAEVLDAFVFGATDVGTARVSGRLGRHTVLWGESLFFGANAIAGTQSPVDAIKASSVPGSTTKEIIRPVGQASGQVQLSPALTLMGYYQYEWERTRLPAAGSYFSVGDFLFDGGER